MQTPRAILVTYSLLVVGCVRSPAVFPDEEQSPPVRVESRRDDPSLRTLLAYYDAQYDAEGQMLRLEFSSPGYHSRVAAGEWVHPTRESLMYALALLQRDDPGDDQRAAAILRRVLPLQDTDPRSPTYGIWPWLLEEPLEQMSTPDLNWADFCGVQLAQMLVRHQGALPPELTARMRTSLRHATTAIRNRNVGAAYSNIAVLGGGLCAAAGEILDDPALLRYGRERLEQVVVHTTRHGSFNEYNSPPYAKVVIAECERTLLLVRDPESRAAAQAIRRVAWELVSGSFHHGTGQWAGPHSRTSRNRLRISTVDFLSRRTGTAIGVHPSMAAGQPRGYAVVPPLACPEDLLDGFRTTKTGQIQRQFIAGAEPTIGTTWFSEASCLGSVNRSTFWTQRKPLIGYWRTSADPAVAFRMRFLHDGRDFASMAVRIAQQDQRALWLVETEPKAGDWHPRLDRPADGRFRAADLRIRFELDGANVTAAVLPSGRYALSAGDHRVVIHTIAAEFAETPVNWTTGSEGDSAYVDGICHAGSPREFDFEAMRVAIVGGIELLDRDEAPLDLPPETIEQDRQTTARWQIMERTLIVAGTPPRDARAE